MSQKYKPTVKSLGTKLAGSPIYQSQFKKLQIDNSSGVLRATVAVVIPDTFEGNKIWGKHLTVQQQGFCGSCWAFATTQSLASRIAIYTGGKVAPILSAGNVVVCNLGADVEVKAALDGLKLGSAYDYTGDSQRVGKSSVETDTSKHIGCDGETLINAWQYLYRFGVVDVNCIPYDNMKAFQDDGGTYDLATWNEGDKLPWCLSTMGLSYDVCSTNPKKPARYYRAGGYYIVPGTASMADGASERTIRQEIYKFGPVSTGFDVHQDFMDWDGKGVYQYDGKSPSIGGHAVLIVGWGIENDVPYWTIMNSWGTEWGDKGFFKFKRGDNLHGMEENCMVGFPDLPAVRLYLDWPVYYTEDDYTMRSIWKLNETGYKQSLSERVLSGEFILSSDEKSKLGQLLYPPNTWPNMKKFIAGKISTASYPIGSSAVLQGGLIVIIISLIIGLLIGYCGSDKIKKAIKK